ncbi:hypothetical protein AAHA92_33819 [Salvia divinorum]|uniref:Uncharacterized protein n=1 Tax=Salvia divinorum TaxID=28513 RepID=A0ABD1FK34_SALDI
MLQFPSDSRARRPRRTLLHHRGLRLNANSTAASHSGYRQIRAQPSSLFRGQPAQLNPSPFHRRSPS